MTWKPYRVVIDVDMDPPGEDSRADDEWVARNIKMKVDSGEHLEICNVVQVTSLAKGPVVDAELVQLRGSVDGLAKRNADLQEQLKLMTANRAIALNIVEEQRERLREVPRLQEALRVGQEDLERLQRRLKARERELERIRTTLYKGRVEEFVKITKGAEIVDD